MEQETRIDESWGAGGYEVVDEAVGAEGKKTPKLTVVALQSGFSENVVKTRRNTYQRYYTPEAVEAALPLIEGLPVYISNSGSHKDRPGLRDRAGDYRNARVISEGGVKKIRTELHVYPHHKDFLFGIAQANPKAFGPSIDNALVKFHLGAQDGKPAAIITEIKNINAALLVERPAAGGAIEGISESQTEILDEGGQPRVDLTKEQFKVENPSLYNAIFSEGSEAKAAELNEAATEEKITKLNESNTAKDEEIATLKAEGAKGAVEKVISESVPEKAFEKVKDGKEVRANIIERCATLCEGITDPDEAKKVVETEMEYISKMLKVGEAHNAGVGRGPDSKTDDGDRKERQAKLDNAAGVAVEEKPPPAEK